LRSSHERAALAVSRPTAQRTAAPQWLRELVEALVAQGQVSAAAAIIGDSRGPVVAAEAGDAQLTRGRRRPLFDLASLTKLWTASLALRLHSRGLLSLATRLEELWPECDRRLAGCTLEDLLRHRAGFVPWTPVYRRCRRRSTVPGLLLGGRLLGARRGTYSDLDYLLWGLSAERALGRSLADLLCRELIAPLGLRAALARDTFWLPCGLGNEREVELAAAQEIRVARAGPPATGRVQDGNARILGPPAGHAGLFATPQAMFALAREWLAPGTLWSPAAGAAALRRSGAFALGWRQTTRRGSGGPALSLASFGHVGFTGGSVWVDPERQLVFVLLTHRTAVQIDLGPVRRRFHSCSLADTGTA
jgi:CubicO group peptidase (beta-lactamase class C family)